jgi:hypothetical protein
MIDVEFQRPTGDLSHLGTRFLVFPQPPFIPGYEQPEVVWLSSPLGSVLPGPADHRMYVVDPAVEKAPYEFPLMPPFVGETYPPAEPGPGGHFDHIPVGSRAFLAAHAFACVRRTIDIWESYWGREIPWFFAPTYERLEIVPFLSWGNAQSGFGFLEAGEDDSRGELFPFALNFDVLAHETGHLILFGALGLPSFGSPSHDFLTYHEAVADSSSLVGLLHFDTALDLLLRRTRGNLLVTNELDRIAELTDERQVRMASHSLRMGDVGDAVHDRSKPFVGALFDGLIEIYQVLLVDRGLATLDPRTIHEVRFELSEHDIERELGTPRIAYERRHFAVKSALIEARDIIGAALAGSWAFLDADSVTLSGAAQAVVLAAERGQGRRFAELLEGCFAWRELM